MKLIEYNVWDIPNILFVINWNHLKPFSSKSNVWSGLQHIQLCVVLLGFKLCITHKKVFIYVCGIRIPWPNITLINLNPSVFITSITFNHSFGFSFSECRSWNKIHTKSKQNIVSSWKGDYIKIALYIIADPSPPVMEQTRRGNTQYLIKH